MCLVDFVVPVFNLYLPGILKDAPSFFAKCILILGELKLLWTIASHFKPAQVHGHSVVHISWIPVAFYGLDVKYPHRFKRLNMVLKW